MRSGKDVTHRLRDALLSEALLLADEARGYFEVCALTEAEALDPVARVRFSCESLKVTTRLMHAVAWLMTRRAVDSGEIGRDEADAPDRRLGDAPATSPEELDALPPHARALVGASVDLYRRVAMLNGAERPGTSPARTMLERLADSF